MIPGFDAVPDDANSGSNSSWTSWIEGNFTPVSHPIGSCAMMSKELGGKYFFPFAELLTVWCVCELLTQSLNL